MIFTNTSSLSQSIWNVFDYSKKFISNALDHVAEQMVKIGRGIPVFRDVTNFSSDPKFCEMVFLDSLQRVLKEHADKEDLGETQRAKLFKMMKRPLNLACRGLTYLDPHIVRNHLYNHVLQFSDLTFKLRFFSEVLLPKISDQEPLFKDAMRNIISWSRQSIEQLNPEPAARAIGVLGCFLVEDQIKLLMRNIIPSTQKASITTVRFCLWIEKESQIFYQERVHAALKNFKKNLRISNCTRSRFMSVTPPVMPWKTVLTRFCLFFALSAVASAKSLRNTFGEALNQRNGSFEQNGRLSIRLFLQTHGLCSNVESLCELPSDLLTFDCSHWNLKLVDFSAINATGAVIVAVPPANCTLTEGDFSLGHFEGSAFVRTNLSGSIVQGAFFDGSSIEDSSFDQLKGNASFRGITSQNSSWRDLRGTQDFSESHLENADFVQDLSRWNKTTVEPGVHTLNFTGSRLEKARFQILFPNQTTYYTPIDRIVNVTFSYLADTSIRGTQFDGCDFSYKDYHRTCYQYPYPFTVTQVFHLSNTNFSNSNIQNPVTNKSCNTPQLFFGGYISDSYFPPNFYFPIQPDVGCTEFYLYAIRACNYSHITHASHNCLTKQCGDVYAENNQTALQEEFLSALKKWDPKYLTSGYFDLRKYAEPNGFCSSSGSCELQPGLFYGNNTYSKLYFNNVGLTSLTRKAEPHIENSRVSGNCLIMGNWTWENSTFDSGASLSSHGNITFRDVSFSNVFMWADGLAVSWKDSHIQNSWLGYPFPPIYVPQFNIDNTTVADSHIYFVGEKFVAKNANVRNTTVTSCAPDTVYEGSLLNDVVFSRTPSNYPKGARYLSIFNSKGIDIRVEDAASLRNATFEGIEKLSLEMRVTENSRFYWNFVNVGMFSSNLSGIKLVGPAFQQTKISGMWAGAILGDGNACFWGGKSPLAGRNVSFENMVLDNVTGCCQVEAEKVKRCLVDKGFEFGANVSCVNYPTIPPKPASKSDTALITALILAGTFGLAAPLAIIIYRIVRLKKMEDNYRVLD